MATIRQRAGKWQAQIRRQGHTPVSKSFIDKRDAERWARSVERDLDRGEYVPPPKADNTTLGAVLKRYAAEVSRTKKSAVTESRRIAKLARDPIAKLLVSKLTAKDLAEFRDRRLKDTRKDGSPISSRTAQLDLVTLGYVLEHARREWCLPITATVRDVRKPPAGRGRDRRLQGDEEVRLRNALAKCGNLWMMPAFVLSLETAMRRGELLKLRWADVDLHGRTAKLRDPKNGHDRVIPLSSTAVEVLGALPHGISGRVLTITPNALSLNWRRACGRAGVEGLRWHDLRHEATSRLVERGLSPVEVASITGHRDLKMLLRYSHLNAQELARKLA